MNSNYLKTTWSLVLFLTLLSGALAHAKPLWEAGVAGAVFNIPDYPGSSNSRTRYLPVPYFVYRGKILRAKDGSASAVFFETKNIEIDVSLSASFPAHSGDDSAREGMPDLDWLGEIGPRLIVHIIKEKDKRKLNFNLPIRAVYSTDFGRMVDRGYVINPNFLFEERKFFNENLHLFARTGVMWASQRTHNYFYEVKPVFANANRPAYEAKEGILSINYAVALSLAVTKKVIVFSFFQTDFLSQSANKDSPLLQRREIHSFGVGFSWTLYESKQDAYQL